MKHLLFLCLIFLLIKNSLIAFTPLKDMPTSEHRFNFASAEMGAKILLTNAEIKGAHHILRNDRDKYLTVPCAVERKWVIVELSEENRITTFGIGCFEYYSSSVKTFMLLGSTEFPCQAERGCMWQVLGSFVAENTRELQHFDIPSPTIVKYLKVLFLSFYDHQPYCVVSLIRVYGSSFFEDFQKHVDDNPSDSVYAQESPIAQHTAQLISLRKKQQSELDEQLHQESEKRSEEKEPSFQISTEPKFQEDSEMDFSSDLDNLLSLLSFQLSDKEVEKNHGEVVNSKHIFPSLSISRAAASSDHQERQLEALFGPSLLSSLFQPAFPMYSACALAPTITQPEPSAQSRSTVPFSPAPVIPMAPSSVSKNAAYKFNTSVAPSISFPMQKCRPVVGIFRKRDHRNKSFVKSFAKEGDSKQRSSKRISSSVQSSQVLATYGSQSGNFCPLRNSTSCFATSSRDQHDPLNFIARDTDSSENNFVYNEQRQQRRVDYFHSLEVCAATNHSVAAEFAYGDKQICMVVLNKTQTKPKRQHRCKLSVPGLQVIVGNVTIRPTTVITQQGDGVENRSSSEHKAQKQQSTSSPSSHTTSSHETANYMSTSDMASNKKLQEQGTNDSGSHSQLQASPPPPPPTQSVPHFTVLPTSSGKFDVLRQITNRIKALESYDRDATLLLVELETQNSQTRKAMQRLESNMTKIRNSIYELIQHLSEDNKRMRKCRGLQDVEVSHVTLKLFQDALNVSQSQVLTMGQRLTMLEKALRLQQEQYATLSSQLRLAESRHAPTQTLVLAVLSSAAVAAVSTAVLLLVVLRCWSGGESPYTTAAKQGELPLEPQRASTTAFPTHFQRPRALSMITPTLGTLCRRRVSCNDIIMPSDPNSSSSSSPKAQVETLSLPLPFLPTPLLQQTSEFEEAVESEEEYREGDLLDRGDTELLSGDCDLLDFE